MEETKLVKPVRSKSGITVLTVVVKPKKCDHGTCIYCPGGDTVPQSYTDKSPAIMRASAFQYEVRKQVQNRLDTLIAMGHQTEKLEVIIIGGTFLQYTNEYKYDYIKGIYDTLNGKESPTLEKSKTLNETAEHRVVALCIENRPDNCTEEDIKQMLEFGATRIELGVQILDDEIYKKTNRGHTIKDVADATKRLKDAGFKVGYHIMPGLPYSNYEKDMEKYDLVWSDSRFRPDQLKLYPCQVVEDSPLAENYEKIGYQPYDNETIKKILIEMIARIPDYCRLMRVMREIPKEKMKTEAASTSMRGEITDDLRKKDGVKEIRLREIGFQKGEVELNTHLKTIEYEASDGKDFFLEVVNDDDVLFGLLRLRFPGKTFIPELEDVSLVRELHVYGQALKLGEKGEISQHKGLGKELVKEAEMISGKAGYKKIAIISGVGVRKYYEKLGYHLEGAYMVKQL